MSEPVVRIRVSIVLSLDRSRCALLLKRSTMRHGREQSDTACLSPCCHAQGMSLHLRHDLALLHQSLTSGKLPRGLSWNEAVELVSQLGEVQPRNSDEFVFLISAVEFLIEYLKSHYHAVARHIIATETVDLWALTQPEIEVIAKRHMIAVV